MSREEFQQMCNNLSSEEVIWLFIQKCCFKITLDVKGFFVLFGNYFKSHGLHKPVAYLSNSETLMRLSKEKLSTEKSNFEQMIKLLKAKLFMHYIRTQVWEWPMKLLCLIFTLPCSIYSAHVFGRTTLLRND